MRVGKVTNLIFVEAEKIFLERRKVKIVVQQGEKEDDRGEGGGGGGRFPSQQ